MREQDKKPPTLRCIIRCCALCLLLIARLERSDPLVRWTIDQKKRVVSGDLPRCRDPLTCLRDVQVQHGPNACWDPQ